ncbi:MAG: hypothetical protein J6K58_04765 [Lachnospiraceae bacterium]|nr:hypothetical protein [Lachnospiraceae bacterium]
MEILTYLITWFQLDLIESAETFPELLQRFFFVLFAMYLILSVFRALFWFAWKMETLIK